MSENTESNFSKYGIYEISDNLELYLPNSEVKLSRISPNVFSYVRKDSEDNLVEKIIPTKSSNLSIELSPIRPLNFPAKRTSYVYLEFETPIFLSAGSSATIYARCPIEIGIFIIHDETKDSLDSFTCDPINARFCLYGSPESGTLCKYSKSEIVSSYEDSIPFFNAVLKVDIHNELSRGHSIKQVVFPVSENSIYYENSKAIMDSVHAVLRKKLTLEILDVDPVPIESSWTHAPTYEKYEALKRVDMGID